MLERDPRLSRAEYWYTPVIHFAAREGHLEAVQLLLDAGADPEWNGLHDGSLIASTPLAWAARTNAVEMVECLLARGAPTNLADDEPWATPLAWAERRQHAGIVSILRRHGAA